MYITVTIEGKGKSAEISLDEARNIKQSLTELQKNGMDFGTSDFIRSALQERVIRTNSSFDKEGIVTGDKLVVVE